MSAITLNGNGRYGGLSGDAKFLGSWERVDSWSKYKITLWNTSAVEVIVEQSPDGNNIDKRSTHQVVAITADPETDTTYESNILRGQIRHPFFRVGVNNPTATYIEECRVWCQAYQNGHLDAVEDRVGIHAVEKVNGEMTPINLVVDANGKNRMCVDAEVSIEDIKLTAQTDSITIFGTHDGTPTAIACDANGNMAIDVKVEGITLTPQTDGISIYGTDGANPVQLQTDATEAGSLKTTNTDVSKMEVNANKASSETIFIPVGEPFPTSFASNTGMGATMDLGTGEDRYRNVLFRGKVDASVKTTPKIGMFYSHDGSNYTSDGTYCSFYKNGTDWEFAFQRSNIGCRYVGLICFVECDVSYLSAVMSKN